MSLPATLSVPGDSLLTTAVARMAAMPACCGSNWMSECSAAGYGESLGSAFTAW